MTDPYQRLADAEARATAARERLTTSVGDLQERLKPATLARTAARDLADASAEVATKGAETVRRNPAIVAGIVAAAGLFLARHRVAGLVHRKKRHETGDGDDTLRVSRPSKTKKD